MPVLSVSFMALLVGVFVVYYLMPQRCRWMVLLAASMIFYLAAGLSSLFYMLITSVTVYASACLMQRMAKEQKAYFKANKLSREEKAAYRRRTKRRRKAALIFTLAVS